ncbi:cell agglutination protein Mam3 [Teratosphaeriaceae sp. CCFEE 6253]|nr:cell agglutination protein Mam3 [Teratosphaeriaceae sp. CCFEE 6253]
MASYTYELAELGDDAHGVGCKCCRFTSGLDLPIPRRDLSKDDMQRLAVGFSTSVLRDWTRLNAIIKRFEYTIQKRWLKKGLKQRREILLKVCPDIPTVHRPDFQGFRNAGKSVPRSRTCVSRAFLWPYINLEDLQQAHPLLLFLGSRGRNLPEDFISADVHAAHLGPGWSFSTCGSTTCGTHAKGDTMVFRNQRTPTTYGKLINPLKGLPASSAKKLVSTSVGKMHPSLGLLGLEIQAEIYSFLLHATILILHDIDPAQYLLAAHGPIPGPLAQKRGEWVTLQDHMLEAPYRLPQGMDLDRIKAIVGARRASAADHVHALCEDPGYFIEILKEYREHDRHALTCTCNACWRDAAAEMLADAFSYFLFWHNINWRFKQMPSIEAQLAKADVRRGCLGAEDELRWAELDTIIDLVISVPLGRIGDGMPSSPRLRHCYPNADDITASLRQRWRFRDPTKCVTTNRVDYISNAIVDGEQRALHKLIPLIQEAQYMLDTEPAAAQLVDDWVLSQFGDLALLAELEDMIDRFKPWSITFKLVANNSKIVTANVGKLIALDGKVVSALLYATTECESLYGPKSTLWNYPVDKRPSKANNDQMRHAEQHLDFFWEEVGESVLDHCGLELIELLNVRGMRKRKLHRTPIWKEPIVVKPITAGPLRALDVNTPRLDTKLSECNVGTTPKTKVKTRGEAPPTPSSETEVVVIPQPTQAICRTPIKVKKRAYKVFSALLPDATAENHQRTEVAWDDLCHAMNSIGMEPAKLYGSVWSFTPTENCILQVTRPIQFHEPKECRRGHKIGSRMVRTFGRRLKHAYGWAAGMFVCE